MNERLSGRVAAWLAHPAGFLAFNIFTAFWFGASLLLPLWLGLPFLAVTLIALAAYLDVVTWFSSATQFTIAYQNDKKAERDEVFARNQIDTMRLTLAVAERIEDLVEQLADDRAELPT